ncbi:DUF6525 family protein [Gymnodinialimonas sp.]
MSGNLGQTRLRKRRRAEDPMREYDRLPPILRSWLAEAALPWRTRSVRRAYERALSKSGDPEDALAELERLQAQRLAKDAVSGVPG